MSDIRDSKQWSKSLLIVTTSLGALLLITSLWRASYQASDADDTDSKVVPPFPSPSLSSSERSPKGSALERTPAGGLHLLCFCGTSKLPLPEVVILRCQRGAHRFFRANDSEVLSRTDAAGSTVISADSWRAGTEIWACKNGYSSTSIPLPSGADHAAISIMMRKCTQVRIICSYEDGAPVPSAWVGVSRMPMGDWITTEIPCAKSDAATSGAFNGPDSDSTLWVGKSDVEGIIALDVPKPGRYFLHAEQDYSVALHDEQRDGELFLSDQRNIRIAFRRLLGACMKFRSVAISTSRARISIAALEQSDPDAPFAVAAINRRLRDEYPNTAVVGFLPRSGMNQLETVEFQGITSEGVPFIRSSPVVPLDRLVIEEVAESPNGEAGTGVIVVNDERGRMWKDVAVKFGIHGRMDVIAVANGEVRLPVGKASCTMANPTWFGPKVATMLDVEKDAKCIAQLDLGRYVLCEWQVVWPFARYETRLSLIITDVRTNTRKQSANWDPRRERLIWMFPGIYDVSVIGAGIASRVMRVVVPEAGSDALTPLVTTLELQRTL